MLRPMTAARGLSPRMRGNLAKPLENELRAGSIPAHAGEPYRDFLHYHRVRVYPRACGGTRADGSDRRSPKVYPRACGGTGTPSFRRRRIHGLSPRMRGNPKHTPRQSRTGGSIPAHAGEPPAKSSSHRKPTVYPRACGGTAFEPMERTSSKGLSPRMRGNHHWACVCGLVLGSIPAHAGEPKPAGAENGGAGVYPRACGGTVLEIPGEVVLKGLSPRMRGNPHVMPGGMRVKGSIPVHAGEPPSGPRRSAGRRVYPRACGGTLVGHLAIRRREGLSPRMRGNRCSGLFKETENGSIPAHAGEPGWNALHTIATRVYPRACGGTTYRLNDSGQRSGLSPRMRGNRV